MELKKTLPMCLLLDFGGARFQETHSPVVFLSWITSA